MMTLLMFLLLSAVSAQAQSSATLRGLDVYRSTVLTSDRARELFVHRITEIVVLRNQRRPASTEKAEVMRKAIELELSKIPGIAAGELTISEYFTSVEHSMYATLDIVDESDRGRLAFAPEPKRTIPDPDGLIADWKAYFEIGSVLTRRGQMPVDRPDCPGFYCLWGGATPDLAVLQSKFVAGAGAKERELKAMQAYSADAEKRAAALFVLSYGTNGEKVVGFCLAALKDPSSSVRGAGLNILADIINHRKDLRVDADLIIPLIDDPSVSVRGKTLGLLVPLVDAATQRKKILTAAPRLLDILKLAEPGSHDLAYTVLGQLSKKAYDRRDFPSWEKWVSENTEGFKK